LSFIKSKSAGTKSGTTRCGIYNTGKTNRCHPFGREWNTIDQDSKGAQEEDKLYNGWKKERDVFIPYLRERGNEQRRAGGLVSSE